MQVYRRESERQECAVEAESVEQRRPGGNHDFKTPRPKLGLAEHFRYSLRPPGALKVARQHAFAKRDAGTKIQNRKLEYDEAT